MPRRPRRVVEVIEKAKALRGQLEAALKLLREHQGSLEALAALQVEPVEASLSQRTKRTRYGEYRYPILLLCPEAAMITECRQVHVTGFTGLAEAFVEAAQASRTLHELSVKARDALELLSELEEIVKRLGEEIEYAEKLAETIKPGSGGVGVG